jgi:hypothetical protein
MSKHAQLPDGTVLEFPDEISDDVMQRSVKTYLAKQKLTDASANPKVPISLNPVAGLQTTQASLGAPKNPTTLNDVLADMIPMVRTGASAAAGAATGLMTGSPQLGGSLGFSTVDELLRKITGEPSGTLSGSKNLAVSIPESAGENYLGGKLFTGAGKVLGGMYNGLKEAISPSELTALRPTASQMGPLPESHPILRTIEDLFAPTSKRQALSESAKKVLADSEAKVQALTGTTIKLPQPHVLTNQITDELQGQFQKSVDESNARGAAARLIAKANVVPKTQMVPSGILDASGNPIMTSRVVGQTEGPVQRTHAIDAITKILEDIKSPTTGYDPDSKIVRTLQNMLDARKDGDIDFSAAWKDKQLMDAAGHGYAPPELDVNDGRFQKVAAAINKDIDESLPKWANKGKEAQQLQKEAKQIVNARHNVFDDLLNTVKLESLTEPDARVNAIIDNPKILRKALIAGNLPIPNNGQVQYSVSNTKRNLQGYQLMRMTNAATNNGSIDAAALNKAINDPKSQESLKALFGAGNLDNIKNSFKNYALVSTEASNQGQRYAGMRIASRGIDVGAGVAAGLAGLTSASNPRAAVGLGALTGVVIGFHGLAKLFTNEFTGPIIGKMFSGEPLGMSQRAAAQAFASVLKGEYIDMQNEKGTEKYRINAQGKPERAQQ